MKKPFLKFAKAKCGQTYYFKLRTCSKTGKTVTYSDFNWQGSGQTSLSGDVHVSVTKETYNSVTLKWSKVNGAAKYAVYVAVGDGKYELWGYQKGTKFLHKGLETGKTYQYKVRPVRDSFEGKDSNEVSAQPVLGSMSKLKVKSVGPGSLKLSWKKVPGASYYVIYRSDTIDGDYETLCEVPGSAASYVDTGLNAASTYYFKICAVAGSCRSEGKPAGQTTKALIK